MPCWRRKKNGREAVASRPYTENQNQPAMSEGDAERQLHRAALIDGAGDLIRVGDAAGVVHRVEVHIVEHVENLGLTFEPHSLGYPDPFDEVEVGPCNFG